MPSYVKLELHNYTTSIAKNNDVRLTENFQKMEPLQLIRVESSVRKFGVIASSTFSFSWWDGRQSVACPAAVRIAHSAVISLYEVCMLHILSLESHLLVHCVKSAISLPAVTGHRDDCFVMPPHNVHFPVTGAVIQISPKLHELFVRRQHLRSSSAAVQSNCSRGPHIEIR
ncbi:hypothetical protein T09_3884 [Trichinella sp. T9]|nr:hypothetical protein T09_3884 [Trichinella sp. T9]